MVDDELPKFVNNVFRFQSDFTRNDIDSVFASKNENNYLFSGTYEEPLEHSSEINFYESEIYNDDDSISVRSDNSWGELNDNE